MRVIHHPNAEAELIEAARFYERRLPGLGAQFLDAVDSAVTEIVADPERWPIEEGEVRHFLMNRFPYAIYYRDWQITRVFLRSSTTAVIPSIGATNSASETQASVLLL